MKIGMMELFVVFVVALVVIGPDKLPYYAKKLGQAMGQFRKFTAEATKDIHENVVEPLEEAQRPLKEAMQPFTDLNQEMQSNVNDIKKSFTDITKPSDSKIPKVQKQPTKQDNLANEPSSENCSEKGMESQQPFRQETAQANIQNTESPRETPQASENSASLSDTTNVNAS